MHETRCFVMASIFVLAKMSPASEHSMSVLPLATRLDDRPNRGKPGLELYIPPCILDAAHVWHSPPVDKPLRIQIEGPAVSIEKLLPDVPWSLGRWLPPFPQFPGPELAKLTYRVLYGQEPFLGPSESTAPDLAVRDEYLVEVMAARHQMKSELDYYGVTFDHLVPVDDWDPEVLQINFIEVETDDGEYANKFLPFSVDVAEYAGKKVLAVPRCCQNRKGTTDRARVNESIAHKAGRFKYDWEEEA
ncbi:hypothetical protein B0T11DRAFT_271886 [Plectosphaerella cucumerina]|uniref:Uncharacterized protein n=1 Tax=Plectosphaerella cucumerina TaxID=40658 RepID=A0A8K0TQI6_9PEZI|nr:hypothetical protein B0T11DRAFT_271886 [Plectosphaerella cucumerina]